MNALGEAGGEGVRCAPARAVGRHEIVGRELGERVAGGLDDRLEGRSAEVEAADESVQPLVARQLARVAGDVDDPRVAAAGEHDEPAAADVRDERLVVEDQRVGPPVAVAVSLVTREAALEVAGAIDLARHEQGAVEQEARLALLDDLEACALERALARRGQLDRLAARERDAPPRPELGMDQHRHAGAAERADEPVHARRVVPVPVAEDDDVDVGRVDPEPAHVVHEAVRRPAGVEQNARVATVLRDRDECREAVLRAQGVVALSSLDEPCRHARPARHRRSQRRSLVRQQRVGHVVDQRRDRQRVDGFERNRVGQGDVPQKGLWQQSLARLPARLMGTQSVTSVLDRRGMSGGGEQQDLRQ